MLPVERSSFRNWGLAFSVSDSGASIHRTHSLGTVDPRNNFIFTFSAENSGESSLTFHWWELRKSHRVSTKVVGMGDRMHQASLLHNYSQCEFSIPSSDEYSTGMSQWREDLSLHFQSLCLVDGIEGIPNFRNFSIKTNPSLAMIFNSLGNIPNPVYSHLESNVKSLGVHHYTGNQYEKIP